MSTNQQNQPTGATVPMTQTSGPTATAQSSGVTATTASVVTSTSASTWTPFLPGKYYLPFLSEDGNNYELWSKALTLALNSCGLWDIIKGSETALDATTNLDEFVEWRSKDQEAQLSILLALKDVGQQCVYSMKTSNESWTILSDWYAGSSDQRTMSLLEKVYNTKLTDTESLQTQLDNITFSAQQLALAGYPMDNKILGCILAFCLCYALVQGHSRG